MACVSGSCANPFTLPGVSVSVVRHQMAEAEWGRAGADEVSLVFKPSVTSVRAAAGKDLLAFGVFGGWGWERYCGSTALTARVAGVAGTGQASLGRVHERPAGLLRRPVLHLPGPSVFGGGRLRHRMDRGCGALQRRLRPDRGLALRLGRRPPHLVGPSWQAAPRTSRARPGHCDPRPRERPLVVVPDEDLRWLDRAVLPWAAGAGAGPTRTRWSGACWCAAGACWPRAGTASSVAPTLRWTRWSGRGKIRPGRVHT